jgi:hypothetical protein
MLDSVLSGGTSLRGHLVAAAFFLCLVAGGFAPAQSASLVVTGRRPALLWLNINGIEVNNLSGRDPANGPVILDLVTDGRLEISVRTNYEFWLTISTETGYHLIYGPDTGLEWLTLREPLLPHLEPGNEVAVRLDWEDEEHPSDAGRAARPVPVTRRDTPGLAAGAPTPPGHPSPEAGAPTPPEHPGPEAGAPTPRDHPRPESGASSSGKRPGGPKH